MSGEQFLYNRPTFPAQLNMAHHLTRGLVACWMLNENAPNSMRAWDSSPYRNHGLVTGALGRWQGRNFDGDDDSINCGKAASLNDLAQLTWEAWIYPKANADRFIDKGQKGARILTTNLFALFYAATTNAQSRANTAVGFDQWHHVVFTYDDVGDRKIRIYKNIVEVGYTTQIAAIGALTSEAANNLLIGTEAGLTDDYNGYIGLVRLYNRVLTLSEIRQLYLQPYDMFFR